MGSVILFGRVFGARAGTPAYSVWGWRWWEGVGGEVMFGLDRPGKPCVGKLVRPLPSLLIGVGFCRRACRVHSSRAARRREVLRRASGR